jgi:hypothetical protein
MRYEQLNLTTAKNLQLCNIELRSGTGIDYSKINGIELDIHQRSLLLNEKIQRFAGYQVGMNVTGLPRQESKDYITKGGLPEYKIQGNIMKNQIIDIRKIPE